MGIVHSKERFWVAASSAGGSPGGQRRPSFESAMNSRGFASRAEWLPEADRLGCGKSHCSLPSKPSDTRALRVDMFRAFLGPAECEQAFFFVRSRGMRVPRTAHREGLITKHVVSVPEFRAPNTALNIKEQDNAYHWHREVVQ